MFQQIRGSACVALMLLSSLASGAWTDLLIGTASTSITPDEPVALGGQWYLRIASDVESYVTANVIALESSREDSNE